MKLLVRILFAGMIMLAGLFIASYIFLVVKGKVFIAKQLESFTGRKVSIAEFDIRYPLTVDIKGLDVEGLAKVESMRVSPNIFGLMFGYVVLNDVSMVRPELTYRRQIPEVIDADTVLSIGPPIGKIKEKLPFRLALVRLTVKDGKFTYYDDTVKKEGMHISMTDISLKVSNFYYFMPYSGSVKFQFSGKIPWEDSNNEEGKVSAAGWVNLRKKDIKATFDISRIDGVYLFPYYESWFGGLNLKKAGIEAAKLNLSGAAVGEDNDVNIDGRLELTDIRRKTSEEGGGKTERKIADFFFAFNQGKIVVNFRTKTRMDKPEFKLIDIKMAFEEKNK